jgi:DNA repair exonuclease SbcCD ATPase subunit
MDKKKTSFFEKMLSGYVGCFDFLYQDLTPERTREKKERRAAREAQRAAERALRETALRKKAEEMEKEKERLQRQKEEKKEREYAIRRQLRVEIEKMPKYSNWRTAIFERCGKRCEMCGSTKDLEIHHRTSFDALLRHYQINTVEKAFECDALWDLNNGSVLCKECHAKMESSKYRESKIASHE